MAKYEAPSLDKGSYTCPHCGTLALIQHETVFAQRTGGTMGTYWGHSERCTACGEFIVWFDKKVVYPQTGDAPPADDDMPKDVRVLYQEAAAVSTASPRAAAALLRVAIETLVLELSDKSRLDDAIGDLVARELITHRLQKMLDTVRVYGNGAVHPGQIDVDDNAQVAVQLFRLVNRIVESGISEVRELDAMYNAIPEGKRQHIDRRDGRDA